MRIIENKKNKWLYVLFKISFVIAMISTIVFVCSIFGLLVALFWVPSIIKICGFVFLATFMIDLTIFALIINPMRIFKL